MHSYYYFFFVNNKEMLKFHFKVSVKKPNQWHSHTERETAAQARVHYRTVMELRWREGRKRWAAGRGAAQLSDSFAILRCALFAYRSWL